MTLHRGWLPPLLILLGLLVLCSLWTDIRRDAGGNVLPDRHSPLRGVLWGMVLTGVFLWLVEWLFGFS